MLNFCFPQIELNISKNTDGIIFVFDLIRKKKVVLTPEEYVRQQFLHYLIFQLNYPKNLIKLEHLILVNQKRKRADIVVYNRLGEVYMIVECKASYIEITDETLFQISNYYQNLNSTFIVLTNGLNLYCQKIEDKSWTNEILKFII